VLATLDAKRSKPAPSTACGRSASTRCALHAARGDRRAAEPLLRAALAGFGEANDTLRERAAHALAALDS
jgi:hypothetical protein